MAGMCLLMRTSTTLPATNSNQKSNIPNQQSANLGEEPERQVSYRVASSSTHHPTIQKRAKLDINRKVQLWFGEGTVIWNFSLYGRRGAEG